MGTKSEKKPVIYIHKDIWKLNIYKDGLIWSSDFRPITDKGECPRRNMGGMMFKFCSIMSLDVNTKWAHSFVFLVPILILFKKLICFHFDPDKKPQAKICQSSECCWSFSLFWLYSLLSASWKWVNLCQRPLFIYLFSFLWKNYDSKGCTLRTIC